MTSPPRRVDWMALLTLLLKPAISHGHVGADAAEGIAHLVHQLLVGLPAVGSGVVQVHGNDVVGSQGPWPWRLFWGLGSIPMTPRGSQGPGDHDDEQTNGPAPEDGDGLAPQIGRGAGVHRVAEGFLDGGTFILILR